MPRLPDLDSLGARPVPQSRRGVASNSRAGAVGQALEGFGENMTRIGQGMVEKQDRLAYAAAKSTLLTADVKLRQELETDPDYETWGARYAEGMAREREAAGKLIRSSSDRELFEADAQLDITRGAAALGQNANARRVSTRVALLDEGLSNLEDVGQNAPDDATREATLLQAAEMVNASVASGDISAVEGGKLRRAFTQNYVVQRIEALRNAEDYDGALTYFEARRGALDAATESRIANLLTDASNNREALVLAEEFVSGGTQETAPAAPSTAPSAAPAMSAMVAITAQSESGNRERDTRGRLVTSPAGAQGRMQVMPATARDPGHGIRPWDGKTDADRSRVGEELLAALMRKYKNDPAKAWAAYNWGEARVDRAVARHGSQWLAYAPAETRAYVNSNVAALGGNTPTAGPAEQRRDLRQIYGSIDARASEENWTPEKTERVKAQAARIVEREDMLINREQEDAYEAALAKAETLGDGFTDPSQLGDAYYRASETQQRTLRNIADANIRAAQGGDVPANGDRALYLDNLQDRDPARFAGENLFQYRHELTPAEFSKFLDDQRRIEIEGPAGRHVTTRSAITSTINFYGPEIGITAADLNATSEDSAAKRERRARYIALKDRMEADIRRLTGGTRAATEDEIKGAFDRATIQVTQGGERVSRFEIDPAAGNVTVPVPRAIKQRILNAWRQAGRGTPTDIQIAQEYMRNKGREGFW